MSSIEKATQIRNQTISEIKAIQADSGLSSLGKGGQIRAVREQATKKLDALRTEIADEVNKKKESLLSQLFSVGHKIHASESEKTLTIMSFRDALFRAENFENPGDALRWLQQAGRTGDTVLAQAIALSAYGRNWHSVVDAFANHSEDTATALSELRALETKSSSQKLQESMAFSLPSETAEERSARVADHSGSARVA